MLSEPPRTLGAKAFHLLHTNFALLHNRFVAATSNMTRMVETTTVETLLERIQRLVAERQQLRERQASERTLERNRRQIADSQHALSRALIERHGAPSLAG